MKRFLLILCALVLALLCRSAAVPDARVLTGAADTTAANTHGSGRSSCGKLLAGGSPDSSVPELRLEEHGASGVLVPSGKSRSYSSGSRRLQSNFRNIFFRGGETVMVSGPELHYLNASSMPPFCGENRSLPVFLQNLRI